MMDYRYLDEAKAEEIDHLIHLDRATFNTSAGDRFEQAVQHAITSIRENPEAWPIFDNASDWPEWDGLPIPRSHGVPKHRYRVIYVVLNDEVVIIAIASTWRKPGYWRDRINSLP